MSSYVALDVVDLALAACLILVNAAVSLAFRLDMERSLAVATLRVIVQLSLVGLVLKWIFAQTSPLWTLALATVMIVAAGYEIFSRQEKRLPGLWSFGLGTGTLLFVGTLGTVFAVGAVIQPEPLAAPRFVLPILGMVLGNAMTGISLVLDTLSSGAERERAAIEARLALGAPRFEALSQVTRRALKTGMMPILNAMSAAGIVSLPGMMTGQILAGVDPVEATKYQILIMFLISGMTALAAVIATFGGVLLITDDRHRLRLDRLSQRRTKT
ncbi:MAG: iron export ABC transporter permease subunit FetB [Hyphomicrobiaceae bacterium]|nr:iron export ABC transporter permease subunit FetB [Hyphomicrobiaceae bacterium]